MDTQTLIRSAAAAVAALHPHKSARAGATRMLQGLAVASQNRTPTFVAPCGYFGALVDGYQHVLQMHPSPRITPHIPDSGALGGI